MQGWFSLNVDSAAHALVVFRFLDAAGIRRDEKAAWQGLTMLFSDIEPQIKTVQLVIESATSHVGYATATIDGARVAECRLMDEMYGGEELELCTLHRDTNGGWYVHNTLPQRIFCN